MVNWKLHIKCIFKNVNSCSSHCIPLSVEPGTETCCLLLLTTRSFCFLFQILCSSSHLTSPLCSLWEEKQYLEEENEIQPKPAVSSSLHHPGVVSETWITTATAVFREDKYEFYFKPPSRLNPSIRRFAIGSFLWSYLKQCEAKRLYITVSHSDKRLTYKF